MDAPLSQLIRDPRHPIFTAIAAGRWWGLGLVFLYFAGVLLAPVHDALREEKVARDPLFIREGMRGELGGGLSFAFLGGFRSVAASLLYVRAYNEWTQRNWIAAERTLQLVTTLEPGRQNFWLSRARWLAHDYAIWINRDKTLLRPDEGNLPSDLEHEFARRGIAVLKEGMRHFDTKWPFWADIAQIQIHRLDDPLAAAESYRNAALEPGAPFFLGRVHAELLREAGRYAQAYQWLTELYPKLPDADPTAAKPVVLERIRELEDELNIPLAARFVP